MSPFILFILFGNAVYVRSNTVKLTAADAIDIIKIKTGYGGYHTSNMDFNANHIILSLRPNYVTYAGYVIVYPHRGNVIGSGLTLEPPVGPDAIYFGESVAMDSNSVAIIANRPQDAYIYRIVKNSSVEVKKVSTSPSYIAYTGNRVAIDGDYAVIAAGLPQAQLYVFKYNGSDWMKQQVLVLSPGISNLYIDVAIDGDYIAAANIRRREVFVYKRDRDSDSWHEQTKIQVQDVVVKAIDLKDNLLAICVDMEVPGREDNAMHVYRRNGSSWVSDGMLGEKGYSVSIGANNTIAVGSYNNVTGDSVHVFSLSNGRWEQTFQLLPPDNFRRQFAYRLKIRNNIIVVENQFYNDEGNNTFVIYMVDTTDRPSREGRREGHSLLNVLMFYATLVIYIHI